MIPGNPFMSPPMMPSSEPIEAGIVARAGAALAENATVAEEADVVVALGGDGLMLQCLHVHMRDNTPIYGMNRGSVGFLMNCPIPSKKKLRL